MNTLTRIKVPAIEIEIKAVLDEISQAMERAVGYDKDTQKITSSIICQACLKHLRGGGSRSRCLITFEVGSALGLNFYQAITLGAAIELLHNASLVHDDINDRANLRRGRPNVRAVYGDDIAILAGDLMISGAYGLLADYNCQETIGPIIRHFHATVRQVIDGQCKDLESTKKLPTVQDYQSIAIAKSGGLIRLALQLPFIASQQASSIIEAAGEAADCFAVSYQIIDDLRDVDEDLASAERPQCLNIFHILATDMPARAAYVTAKELAIGLIERTELICDTLPYGSGEPLTRHSKALRNLLDSKPGL
jgi:geranylgeranyl diphosphate synthase type II